MPGVREEGSREGWERRMRAEKAGRGQRDPTHLVGLEKCGFCPEYGSVQFSLSVVSDSLRPHGLQHARPPYPSPAPGTYSNSCPLSL